MARILAFITALVLALPLSAQDYPGYTSTTVNDFAAILDPETTDRLTDTLNRLFAETGIEMTVVTIHSRANYGSSPDIETFTTGLFNAWGVGAAAGNDGIMLLVADQDREMRLELGSGYPRSYDWLTDDIVGNTILPYFRDGDLPAGIEAGVADTITRVATPFAAGQEAAEPATPNNDMPQGWATDRAAEDAGSTSSLGGWIFGAFAAAIAALIARRPIGNALMRFRACPRCGQKTLSRSRTVIDKPSKVSTGLARTTVTCSNCDYSRSDDTVLNKISGKSSSSGSRSSFGGGRSSGGGSTGKW